MATALRKPTKDPSPKELLEEFPALEEIAQDLGRFLREYADLGSEYVGRAGGDPVDCPLETMVYFSGPLSGFLVVRGYEGLGKLLGRAKRPIPGDAFEDFAHHYFERLAGTFWKVLKGRLSSLPPRNSGPDSWPGKKAQAAFALLVEDQILEVRLWVGTEPAF